MWAEEFWAVKDVSFELKRGECLGLIGRNGAGKTTLLRMLNGLIKPDKGRIEMLGRDGGRDCFGSGGFIRRLGGYVYFTRHDTRKISFLNCPGAKVRT